MKLADLLISIALAFFMPVVLTVVFNFLGM